MIILFKAQNEEKLAFIADRVRVSAHQKFWSDFAPAQMWRPLSDSHHIGNLRINFQFYFHGIFPWRKIDAPKFVHIDLTLFHVEIHTRQGYDLWHCHERLMFNPSLGSWFSDFKLGKKTINIITLSHVSCEYQCSLWVYGLNISTVHAP